MIRDDFFRCEEDFGKIMVHGHTPVHDIDFHSNRINIDTGAYATGQLTCPRIERDCVLFSAGTRVGGGARQLAELVIDLTGSSSKIVCHPLPQDDPKQRCPDIGLARSLLGWQPQVQLREGLTNASDYFERLLREKKRSYRSNMNIDTRLEGIIERWTETGPNNEYSTLARRGQNSFGPRHARLNLRSGLSASGVN